MDKTEEEKKRTFFQMEVESVKRREAYKKFARSQGTTLSVLIRDFLDSVVE